MSNFTPLTREEKEIRDSISSLTLKEKLEFFVIPDGYKEKLDAAILQVYPFLTSDKKIEVAIAVDCHYKLSVLKGILNLLEND
jgi:hypothetical protein